MECHAGIGPALPEWKSGAKPSFANGTYFLKTHLLSQT